MQKLKKKRDNIKIIHFIGIDKTTSMETSMIFSKFFENVFRNPFISY